MALVNKAGTEHCTLGEALEILRKRFAEDRSIVIATTPDEALGRILARDILSLKNVPHYTASAVDGYAILSSATIGATPATPSVVQPGKYSWVNTGAAIPGAAFNAVVMVEDTSLDGEDLVVKRPLTAGANVRSVGEDVMTGQPIARHGDEVTPALCSLLLCAGIAEIDVYAAPRVLFIPTGNEIVSPGRWLAGEEIGAGFVVDSNSTLAKATFAGWGYSLDVAPILPDDPDMLRDAVSEAVDKYDMVLVSAGSAKGRRDHSAEVFSSLGEVLFRWLLVKPGRPALAADIRGVPVVCLPGFPMSSAVTLWSIVYPLLLQLAGRPADELLRMIKEAIGSVGELTTELMVSHTSQQGFREWLRMKVARVGEHLWGWPLASGASVLWALTESDGITLLDERALECERGQAVDVMLTKKFDLARRMLFQGSDDPAIQLLVTPIRNRGADIVLRSVGSMGGLAALARGEAHVAAAHLLDPATGIYNDSFIAGFSAGKPWFRKLVFYRTQGIILPRDNPKNIKGFRDLTGGLSFVNRQPGAGTRVLLDYMLKQNGIDASEIDGYDYQATTHLEAANRVAAGIADATLGIKSAADALGLDFIPIAEEPYELVIPTEYLDHPGVAAMLDSVESPEWRHDVEVMGGYRWPG